MAVISITTVLYNNNSSQIERLVSNVLSVMEPNEVDYYLINNSPTNLKLASFLKKYDSFKNVHVITPSTNLGFAAGNNLVLRQGLLRSKYHFLVNPDIYISGKDQIQKMLTFMDDNEQYGMLAPLVKFPNGKVQHLLKQESTVLDMALRFVKPPFSKKRREQFVSLPDGYKKIHLADNVPGSFMLFRTGIFKRINGFDPIYFLYMEDCDITMKVNQVSKTVFFPKAFVYHEWQRENRKSFHGVLLMLKSMYIYFNKWGWKWI